MYVGQSETQGQTRKGNAVVTFPRPSAARPAACWPSSNFTSDLAVGRPDHLQNRAAGSGWSNVGVDQHIKFIRVIAANAF